MINKLKFYIKEVVSFIVVLTILANMVSYYKASDLNQNKLDIENISLNNKPILIHFWSTWCPTCKIEASNIQTISENFNVLTIAVNSGENSDINKYLNKNNLDFKVINDKDSFYARKFNITVFPTTLIYDKNKNLMFSDVGYTSTFGLWVRMWWAEL